MADVICLDSDSDFESSPPKITHTSNNRGRRKTRRGQRGKAGQSSSSKENISNQVNSSASKSSVDLVSSTAASISSSQISVDSVDSFPVTASVSSDLQSNDIICVSNPLPDCHPDKCSKNQAGSKQSRKTARRGLARKANSSDLAAITSGETLTESTIHKKASVYSDGRVSHSFQNVYSREGQLTNDHRVKESENLSHLEDKNVEAQQEENHTASSSDETDVNIMSVQEGGADVNCVRSPTPPPEVKTNKPHRMSRRAQKALRTLNSVKARIGGAQRNAQTPPTAPVESPVIKAEMLIKVRFLSKVYRLKHKLNQPFHKLLAKLSREIGKAEDHLGFFLNDSSLPLTSNPKDVSLSVADIIECYDMTEIGGNFSKGDSVDVVIQCSNSKKKTTMTAFKRLPIQDLMDRYASKFDLDISTFSFCFDGEYVSPTDMLLNLDVEDGDVLDVVPKLDRRACSSHAHRTEVITLI